MLVIIFSIISVILSILGCGLYSLSSIFIGIGISIIVQLSAYYSHIEEIEKIKEEKENIKVYQEQANEVLAEIKLYLIDKFPEYEMKIFEKITSQTVDILAVKYPELKTDEVFKKYIDSLVSHKNKIYSCLRFINKLRRQLNTRRRTMKLTVIPILPKEE